MAGSEVAETVAGPVPVGRWFAQARSGSLAEDRDRPRLDRPARVGDTLDVLGPDECVDDHWVELDAGELAQLRQRLLGGQWCHPVGAGGRHGLEGVGDVEDPGELGDLVTDEPVGVAGAVVPLVVVADDRQLGGELRDRGDDLRTQDRDARS